MWGHCRSQAMANYAATRPENPTPPTFLKRTSGSREVPYGWFFHTEATDPARFSSTLRFP